MQLLVFGLIWGGGGANAPLMHVALYKVCNLWIFCTAESRVKVWPVPPPPLPAARFKAMVSWLLLLPLYVRIVFGPCYVMHYLLSFPVFQSTRRGRKSWLL